MRTISNAVKAAVACVVPLLACSSYYTVERLGSTSIALSVAASMALPVFLLSATSTGLRMSGGDRTSWKLWVSAGFVAASTALLCYVWL